MNKLKVSMIAAIASGNRALGKGNELIYKIPEDLKRFKELTSNHVIIMGRKTFESIAKALPNRINIVITSNPNFSADNVVVTHSLDEALRLASLAQGKLADREIFIIGGGLVYKEAIERADKLYLTIVEGSPEADTFFPDYSNFKKVVFKESHEEKGLKYEFLDLER